MAQEKERKIQNKPVNRYVLEKYTSVKSRHTCPNCLEKHTYTRFIDVTTGEYLDEKFGRCDRVEKCGYFESPTGKDLQGKTLMVKPKEVIKGYQEEMLGISLMENSKVLESLTFNDNLSLFLFNNFDPIKVKDTLVKYKVGESKKWKSATTFWQIDQQFDTRTGKIILYDVETGKRVKKPRPFVSWEHVVDKYLKDKQYYDFNMKQCLFGEHLVTSETDEIHIVESEKTALLCDIIGGKTWLALGGIEMINEERLLPFKHCKMIFYPDKGAIAVEKWQKKLASFTEVFNIQVNTSLEKSDLIDGSDLGDLIIQKYSKK